MVWWDRWLVFGVMLTAVVEVMVRDDVVLAPVALALALVLPLSLLWRRIHPLGMVVIVFGAVTVMNVITMAGGTESFGLYSMAFLLLLPYSLVRWGSGKEVVVGLGVVLVGYTTGIAADFTSMSEAIGGFVFALSPALIGAVVRSRDHARRQDREQAVLSEREQIARELHDTVAHHVSAIAIRAQAGKALAATDPHAPLEALDIIEAEASKTLAEMRSIVGVLRQGDDPILTPQPGIANIEDLAPEPADGPALRVETGSDLEDLAPAVDAALYRIAQEGITNAVRHGRNVTAIYVNVNDLGERVELLVHDDGEETYSQVNPDPGFGIIGMEERAKLLGGWCTAGPAHEGGWTVRTIIPKAGASR